MSEAQSIARSFRLPFPPSVNGVWRIAGKGMRLSDAASRYRVDVRIGLLKQRVPSARLDGWLGCELIAYPPDRYRRDLDNLCKSILDALRVAGVYHDDEQIADLHLRWGTSVPGGAVDCRLWQLDEAGHGWDWKRREQKKLKRRGGRAK